MKKVLELLEAHVQWLAVGLGGLFLLFMVWTYIIGSPASVTEGNNNLGPGTVDKYVLDHQVQTLDTAMHNTDVPAIDTSPIPPRVASLLHGDGVQVANLPGAWASSITRKIEVVLPGKREDGKTAEPGKLEVVKLPEIPAVSIVATGVGKSNVKPPDANNLAGVVAPAENPGDPKAQPVVGQDVYWATVRFLVPTPEIAAAFSAANIPQLSNKTLILQVKMIREEKMLDGSWGNPTIVPLLKNGVAVPPYPAANADVADQQKYIAWATTNQPEIIQPTFYTVLKGDTWTVPGEEKVAAADAQAPFDAKMHIDDTPKQLGELTLQQRQEVQREKAKRDEEAAKTKTPRPARETGPSGPPSGTRGGPPNFVPPPPPPPPGGGGGGTRPRRAVNDPERPANHVSYLLQNGPPRGFVPPPPPPPPPMGADGRPLNVPQPPGVPAQAYTPGAVTSTVYPLPVGEFTPRDWPKGLVGWAHDETVEPGKTYRYKIVYSIENPIYLKTELANPQSLAAQMEIVSAESVWTDPVVIPDSSNFYVAGRPNPGSVKFDVFIWQKGQAKNKSFDVQPGDLIGGKDGDVDYSTGWTLVDIRTDRSGEPYAIVMDPNGKLLKRDYAIDRDDPKYKNQKGAVASGASAAAR